MRTHKSLLTWIGAWALPVMAFALATAVQLRAWAGDPPPTNEYCQTDECITWTCSWPQVASKCVLQSSDNCKPGSGKDNCPNSGEQCGMKVVYTLTACTNPMDGGQCGTYFRRTNGAYYDECPKN
jgi:hypothetical protein